MGLTSFGQEAIWQKYVVESVVIANKVTLSLIASRKHESQSMENGKLMIPSNTKH
jgi:hypothetical protein